MEQVLFWGAALSASVFVGIGKGGIPMAAALAVPVLSLVVSPLVAAGVLLPVYVVSDAFGLYAYRQSFDRRVLLIILPGMSLGVALGWATASIVPERAVTVLVGVIGLSFALYTIKRRKEVVRPKVPRAAPGLFWGSVSGFTSFISHSGAAPYQVYTLPLGLSKKVFAGTTTIAFAFVNLIKLLPYAALGQLSVGNLRISALLIPAGVVSVFAGLWLVNRLPETVFFHIVIWTLLLVSISLIWGGLLG